ncbi:MAG: hypothetical protein ABFD03_05075, partial [Clostridiaceae bacterium]
MLKFSKSSLLGLVPTKKATLLKQESTDTPAPAPSPETPHATTTSATPTTKTAVAAAPTSSSGKLPEGIDATRRDELFRLMNGYYDQPQAKQQSKKNRLAVIAPVIKPADQAKLGGLVMMTDGGQSRDSEDGLIYDPRTRESGKGIDLTAPISDSTKTGKQKLSPALGIPAEHAELAEIVAMLPDDFDFEGWENMTAFQQEKAIRNSGLSKEDQMKILNAGTSIETIALVQDINMHHELYGISEEEALAVSKELFSIANARIGVKSHAMPYSLNGQAEKTFLAMLDEREASLLADLNYGVVADFSANVPGQRNRPQLPALLGDDSKGVPLLYEGGDIFEISDSFFEDAAAFDEIRDDIESGKIIFRNEDQKESYLEYLDSQAAKNETIYRR